MMARLDVTKRKDLVRRPAGDAHAVLVALTIVLLGFIVMTATAGGLRRDVAISATVVPVQSMTCVGGPNQDRLPKHKESGATCCIMCSVRNSGDAKPFVMSRVAETTAAPRALIHGASRIVVASVINPLRRTIAWSSRAPPSFS